jgi:hypothetical protein
MRKYLSHVILNIVALFTTRVPVVKLSLSGFQYTETDIHRAILTKAISFTFEFSREVKDLSKTGWSAIGKLSNGKILLVE